MVNWLYPQFDCEYFNFSRFRILIIFRSVLLMEEAIWGMTRLIANLEASY